MIFDCEQCGRRGMRVSSALVIGIDCATDPRNVGLAFGSVEGPRVRLNELAEVGSHAALDAWVSSRLERDQPVLLALDAPLGWPSPLGDQLATHSAGDELRATAHQLFRRGTDDRIYKELQQRPLDVGADRIARCAHAALGLLARVRNASGLSLPLAWSPGAVSESSCIEVYPAATLASRDLSSRGYKGKDGAPARAKLIAALAGELEMSAPARATLRRSDHVLDAALCTLAAADFVRCDVIDPPPERRAPR